MRLTIPLAALLLVVALAAALAGSRVEAYGSDADAEVTALDRLCEVVNSINVDDDDVEEMCAKHLDRKGADFCVKGCDPASLCGMPALVQCASGTRTCDVTHMYVGPHLSSFNDKLPRFFLIKHGFCLRIHTDVIAAWTARVDRALLEVMLAFPKSFVIPEVGGGMHGVCSHWCLDTSTSTFQVPFENPPALPASLGYTGGPSIPAKTPAFAVYETSTTVDGARRWREVDLEEDWTDTKTGLIPRDIRERRPASPDKMVFAIFKRFPGGADETAYSGVHNYVYNENQQTLSTLASGTLELGKGPVSLLSSVVVDMKEGGKVLEVREVVYNAGVYRLGYKVPDGLQFPTQYSIDTEEKLADRYFLGAIDPLSCMEMLEGEG